MNISQTFNFDGKVVTFTWIDLKNEGDLKKYSPLTQAYAICYNDNGEALILDQKGNGTWTLPGGTVESGEAPVETLKREVMEEADITITDIKLLGVQKVKSDKPTHYETRYVAKIKELLPQTIDPAKGRVHERKFVPVSQINDHLKWGQTGQAIFDKAKLVILSKVLTFTLKPSLVTKVASR